VHVQAEGAAVQLGGPDGDQVGEFLEGRLGVDEVVELEVFLEEFLRGGEIVQALVHDAFSLCRQLQDGT
jgi:hypothetical protein